SDLSTLDVAYETESDHDGADWSEEPSDESPATNGGFAPPPPAPPPPAQTPPSPAPEPSRVEVTDDALDVDPLTELGALQRTSLAALETSLSSDSPDCDRAAVHRDRICELAQKICHLTRELPDSLKGNCDDGNARCERAKGEYSRSCN